VTVYFPGRYAGYMTGRADGLEQFYLTWTRIHKLKTVLKRRIGPLGSTRNIAVLYRRVNLLELPASRTRTHRNHNRFILFLSS
jgi:hypothetical protein